MGGRSWAVAQGVGEKVASYVGVGASWTWVGDDAVVVQREGVRLGCGMFPTNTC